MDSNDQLEPSVYYVHLSVNLLSYKLNLLRVYLSNIVLECFLPFDNLAGGLTSCSRFSLEHFAKF